MSISTVRSGIQTCAGVAGIVALLAVHGKPVLAIVSALVSVQMAVLAVSFAVLEARR